MTNAHHLFLRKMHASSETRQNDGDSHVYMLSRTSITHKCMRVYPLFTVQYSARFSWEWSLLCMCHWRAHAIFTENEVYIYANVWGLQKIPTVTSSIPISPLVAWDLVTSCVTVPCERWPLFLVTRISIYPRQSKPRRYWTRKCSVERNKMDYKCREN